MRKAVDYKIPAEPETYEEAVKILKESHYDQMHKDAHREVYVRSGIAVGIGIAVALIVASIYRDFSIVPYILATTLLIGAAFLMPLLDLRAMRKNAEKGEVFQKYTEDEIMEEAKKYIRIYTEYVERKTKG